VPGRGSRFVFSARFGVPPNARHGHVDAGEAPLRGRLLIVDDNATARPVLAGLARSCGLDVVEADGGAAALAAIDAAHGEGRPFRVVLLDWQMPQMDGVECAARIAASARPPPAILMMTGYDGTELSGRLAAAGLGVGEVLIKPIASSVLRAACAKALGGMRRMAPHGPTPAHAPTPSQQRLRGARILLVEDNDINQELALELLGSAGMVVTLAVDGSEALAALEREAYDAVLMDCQMPVMDGYEATRRIRSEPRWQQLPVIAMTANAMTGDRELAIAAGMNDHVAKPLDVEAMFETIARWVGRG
jgi:CheY-like chemotaxis protein